MSYRVWNLIKNVVLFFGFCWLYFDSAFIILLTLIYIYSFVQCYGDTELNPGPKELKIYSFQSVIGILVV